MKPQTEPQHEETAGPAAGEEDARPKGLIRENLEAVIIALLLALFIRAFLVQPFKIPSSSMERTLLIGDQIFVSKFAYGIRMPFSNKVIVPTGKPERGDIVVFKYPKDSSLDFIKRVIAVPGDTFELAGGRVFINGEEYPQQYGQYVGVEGHMTNGPWRYYGPLEVPEGKYFVMGDNRDRSNDSRFWGFVDFGELRGRAFMIYYSKDRNFLDVRWNRVCKTLH